MKLSYNPTTKQYQVTELGRLIDSDPNFDALAIRQGFVSDEEETFDGYEELEATTAETTDLF
jgi:hypothetical protein